MELPEAERALVDSLKVKEYLLSPSHPVGRFKATFFFSLGYAQDDWERLRDDLIHLARSGSVTPGQPSPYGKKYEVRGILTGPLGRSAARPLGRSAKVTAVWIVINIDDAPRLVTAYPG